MPIYDFKCEFCGYEEKDRVYTKFDSVKVEKCPKCGKEGFKKQPVRTNFKLNWRPII